MKKSKLKWQKQLDTEQYMILREEGTERAGSSELNSEKDKDRIIVPVVIQNF